MALTLLCPAPPSPLAVSADQESMVASNLMVFIVDDDPAVRDAPGLLLCIRGQRTVEVRKARLMDKLGVDHVADPARISMLGAG